MNEKEKRYFTRTFEHINRVQQNMLHLITTWDKVLDLDLEDCRILAHNVRKHDQSKFSDEQFLPYIELTEYYHQKKTSTNKEYKYPEGVQPLVAIAVQDHYEKENHHAERVGGNIAEFTRHEAIEVVCDLQAMAQEFGEGDCSKFFEEAWVPKYKETSNPTGEYYKRRVTFMRKVIECFKIQNKLY